MSLWNFYTLLLTQVTKYDENSQFFILKKVKEFPSGHFISLMFKDVSFHQRDKSKL